MPVGKQKIDFDVFCHTGAFKSGCRIFDDCVNIKFGFIQSILFRIHGIKNQKIMCQSGQPFGFPKDNIQVLSLHFRRNGSIEDGLDITFDGSQRGTGSR